MILFENLQNCCFRRLLSEREKTLADLRDEAASRASLNFDGSRLGDFSETGSEHGSAYPMYKSFESLDVSYSSVERKSIIIL